MVFIDLEHPKRNLGWLGAIIVVALLAAGVIVLLVVRSGPSDEKLIRGYYRSPEGGGAARSEAQQLRVVNCSDLGLTHEGAPVEQCDVRIGNVAYYPCFTFSEDRGRVLTGVRDLAVRYPGCDSFVFDPTKRRFRSLNAA